MAENLLQRPTAGPGTSLWPVPAGKGWSAMIAIVAFWLGVLVCLGMSVGVVNSAASLYICRDRSGTVHFTNVPAADSCQRYTLERGGRAGKSIAARVAVGSTPYPNSSPKASRNAYDSEIRRIGRQYNVDPPLIKAIIHAESSFDHRAVSRRGAQGLMQLMPDTARELRVRDPFDPQENIDGGTRYMRYLLDSFNNDLVLSLAAYNAGPGMVQRSGGVPKIAETRRYVHKVLTHYKTYKASW